MSMQTEEDLETIPDGELMDLPSGAIPPGWLSEFFGRRAALFHQQDADELALELSGSSTRQLMIFPGTDPKEKQRREDEDRRRAWLATQPLLEYTERSDRLLARIDEQERAIQKRRKERSVRTSRLRRPAPGGLSYVSRRARRGCVARPISRWPRCRLSQRAGRRSALSLTTAVVAS